MVKLFGRSLLTVLMFLLVQTGSAQIRFKSPKVDVTLISAYDSNILRVSEFADSNRVSGVTQRLDVSAVDWIYWSGGIKSYLSFSGDYNWFSSNYPENAGSGYLKLKTFVDIPWIQSGGWIPEVRWDFEILGALLDRYYSNRSLGEEFATIIDRISGRTMALGDLFDRKYLRLSTGLRFSFAKGVMAELEYYRQANNYTDIGDPATGDFYSLDNTEHDYLASVSVTPKSWLTVQLGYNRRDRTYDHKLASDINGDPIPNLNRTYLYNEYDIRLITTFENIEAHLRYLNRLRSDDGDGYYNYNAQKISLGASYHFLPDWTIFLDYDTSAKLYDHITLGGNILDNSYYDFEGRVVYQLSPSFSLAAAYLYEGENSSYEKFSYARHISFIELVYMVL